MPCTAAAFAQLCSEMLRDGYGVRFRAGGGSMHPLVRDGDVLVVRPVDARSIRVGDLVLCSGETGRVVVHRVVRRRGGESGALLTVQGDRLARPDGAMPAASVYGRVALIERDGVQIDCDEPAMKWLGRLAALRSRSSIARGGVARLAGRALRTLPGLSKYLA